MRLLRLYGEDEHDLKDTAIKLLEFYSEYLNIARIASPQILNDSLELVKQAALVEWKSIPRITYIICCHNICRSSLARSLRSVESQVGVKTEALLIIDGNKNDLLIAESLAKHSNAKINLNIVYRNANGGIGKCRNTGLARADTEFFSYIDPGDVVHPLRSLRAIIKLALSGGSLRIETTYSRVNFGSMKLYLMNNELTNYGHSSFVAMTRIRDEYGYFVDLREHEDTEYMQRLQFFNVPVCIDTLASHYFELDWEQLDHLSDDCRTDKYLISNHPYLAGSYAANINEKRSHMNDMFKERYYLARQAIMRQSFPLIE